MIKAGTTQMRFKQNLGFNDRQLRLVFGTLMLVAPMFAAPESVGLWAVLMLAGIPVITTAIIGWDPVYALLSKTTFVERAEDIKQRNWSYANMGIIDRSMRVGAGAVMLYALMTMDAMTASLALTLFAIPLIATATIAWDPLYAMFGINTFGSRTDVEAAEPQVEEQTLATLYIIPEEVRSKDSYVKAA